ncbi:unnamed protein product [Kuraishia capsulata CBS 1993]|uniref:histidine kinase n=1 Tax=Kuraishia capsulata CBS 1993 TaxID=1382522 RepID=W6MNJ0_9ASCO|nr:uncharacterized protein KUCA_T00004216001 [Kuraishia capsulata CBS 1993]CDK28234.1 unnamed protein product [Kuraishia capsulata CBS 1993]
MVLHRLRISIRTQLIALVCIVALLSLVILAIITGVYFTNNFTKTRSERLEIIAQLKASQMEQSFYYFYYQVYYLSTRETLQDSLLNHKAGNTSSSVTTAAMNTIQQFLDSSDTFAQASLYDLSLEVVGNATNDVLSVNTNVSDSLYPFSNNKTFTEVFLDKGGYIKGPTRNDTSYFISLTLPIYTNASVLISTPDLSGYLSMIIDVNSFESVANDTTALEDTEVTMVRPIMDYNNESLYDAYNHSQPTGFRYIFPPKNEPTDVTEVLFSIYYYLAVLDVFLSGDDVGDMDKVRNPFGQEVAVGYSQVDLMFDTWAVIVEQERGAFLQPVNKLVKIIAGTVIAIAVFMCLVTFPLAHFGVRPIIRLQKATEAITQGRGLKKGKKRKLQGSSDMLSPRSEHDFNAGDSPTEEKFRHNSVGNGSRFSAVSGMLTPNSDASFHVNDSPSYPQHFSTPIIVSKGSRFIVDELTELTDAFNVMTEELDRQYSHLEDRVRERTKELEVAKIQAESARMQAEAANEAKTVFIANISHELRTPLNGILGMTAIAMTETSIGKVKESLDLIFRSGELLLHILTQLLTFSKNQLDKSKLENRNFQMIEVASQVKSIFGKTAKDQKVILSLVMKPNLLRKMILFGDSNRIIQVVMNLVSNSLKFTPEQGTVSVVIRVLGEYDEERSRRCDYERVFVKKPHGLLMAITEQETNNQDTTVFETESGVTTEEGIPSNNPTSDNTEKIFNSDTDGKTSEKSVVPDQVSVSSRGNNSVEIVSPQDDTQTLHTLSSSVYESAIESANESKKAVGTSNSSVLIGSSFSEDSDDYVNTSEEGKEVINEKEEDTSFSADDDGERFAIMDEDDDDLLGKQMPSKSLKNRKRWVIEITVSDTGTGIEESLQEKVFEAFVQGDQTLSRSYGGTGLGLSICRQLAKMMHGTLTLKSEVGCGSTFTFKIPLPQTGEILVDKADEEEFFNDDFHPDVVARRESKRVTIQEPNDADIHEIQSNSGNNKGLVRKASFEQRNVLHLSVPIPGKDNSVDPSAQLLTKPQLLARASTGTAHSEQSSLLKHRGSNVEGMRILVAEDNTVNQEVIKRMLNLEGFTDITLACDGSEAIEILRSVMSEEETFDLIFMDVQMPNIDGLLATKLIRQEMKYEGPIVALTAFADKSNEEDCLEAGMSGFLSKPIRRNQLRKIILELCPKISKDMMSSTGTGETSEEFYGARLKSF